MPKITDPEIALLNEVASDDLLHIIDVSDTTHDPQGSSKKTTIASLMRSAATSLITYAGRFYLYADNRWVTNSDDNYGVGYFQFQESAGSSTNPTAEWEHFGTFIPSGRTVKKLHLIGRASNVEVTDLEIHIILRRPNDIDIWNSGLNSDAEDNDIVLYRDFFFAPAGGGDVFTNSITHTHKRTIDLDALVDEDSFLSIYVRPVGTLATTYYFMNTMTWEIS